MKTRTFPPDLLFFLFLSLLLTGCWTQLQLYEGPRLPESEEGTLGNNAQVSDLWIVRVDDELLGLEPGAWKDEQDCILHLLPGEHTVFVTPLWRLINISSFFGGVSPAQMAEMWNSIDGWLLKLVVEPGHQYVLGSDDSRWDDMELEVVFTEPDTIVLSRPEGWKEWTPYITDHSTQERVGEIVSLGKRGDVPGGR
ncbi:hypothetical protein ACFL0I_00050 [Gemmatimonadota bacterium]